MKIVKVALIAVAVVALGGCTSAQAVPKPTRTTEAKPADWGFCSHLTDSMSLYADVILAVSQKGTVDPDNLRHVGAYIDQLRSGASTKAAGMIADYAEPYNEIKKAVDYSGHVSLDTTKYKTATVDMMSYCANTVGYHNG